MSPEALKGEFSFKSDIWAAGCVLYQMVTGRKTFQKENPIELQKQIELGIYDEPECSPGCKDLISKMICLDIQTRFSAE